MTDRKILTATQCCGVKELMRIANKTPEQVLQEVAHDLALSQQRFGLLTFTSNDGEEGYGTALMKYIIDGGYGSVVHSDCVRNPNTVNFIRLFAWTPNMEKLNKLAEAVIQQKKDLEKKIFDKFPIGSTVRVKRGHRTTNRPKEYFSGTFTVVGLDNDTFIRLRNPSSYASWVYYIDDIDKLEIYEKK